MPYFHKGNRLHVSVKYFPVSCYTKVIWLMWMVIVLIFLSCKQTLLLTSVLGSRKLTLSSFDFRLWSSGLWSSDVCQPFSEKLATSKGWFMSHLVLGWRTPVSIQNGCLVYILRLVKLSTFSFLLSLFSGCLSYYISLLHLTGVFWNNHCLGGGGAIHLLFILRSEYQYHFIWCHKN